MGRYALVCGLALLMLGVGVVVAAVRHDHALDAEQAVYDAALRQASAQLPRFAVSYVQVPLSVVGRFSRGRYTMVKTEVARRIETGRPALHPDLAALAGGRTDPVARAFREQRALEREVWVVAVLVTQKTPGAVARLRLDVERLAINGFWDMTDASDLVPPDGIFRDPAAGTKRRDLIEWIPGSGTTAFVPLALLHRVEIHASLNDINSFDGIVPMTSNVVLGPRRLFMKPMHGAEVEIKIGHALELVEVTAASSP